MEKLHRLHGVGGLQPPTPPESALNSIYASGCCKDLKVGINHLCDRDFEAFADTSHSYIFVSLYIYICTLHAARRAQHHAGVVTRQQVAMKNGGTQALLVIRNLLVHPILS